MAYSSPPPCGEGVGGSDIRRQRSLDFVRHTFDIPDHIVIPKAQNFEPLFPQIGIACGIHSLSGSGVMLAAVHLNHKPRRIAGEVYDKMIDRHLPTEMETLRLQRPEKLPKLSFGVG